MTGERGDGYTYTYFRTISPAWLRFALLAKGVAFEPGRPLRYLELGFGQGLSLVIHAAASGADTWGNDLGPSHVAHARELAAAAGATVRIMQESFAELAERRDLPQFDVIVLHGVWTWISAEDSDRVIEIVSRNLAPGGLFYISYNSKAGWAAASLLREIISLHAEQESPAHLPVTARAEAAVAFAMSLANSGVNYFTWNPTVVAQLRAMPSMNRVYLAHEFVGDHWRLTSFTEMAARLREAGLNFAASAFLLENEDRFTVPERARSLYSTITNPALRGAVRESFVNPQFRQDIFVNGPLRFLEPGERLHRLRGEHVMLTAPPSRIAMKLQGPVGEIALDPAVYGPLLQALAADAYAPKTLAQLADALGPGKGCEQLVDELILLTAAGHVRPTRPERDAAASKRSCLELNRHLCKRARTGAEIAFLASPVLGGGVDVDRFSQLFLLAMSEGKNSPGAWAEFAWECLSANGEKVFRQGRGVETAAESVAMLTELGHVFERDILPVLRVAGATLEP